MFCAGNLKEHIFTLHDVHVLVHNLTKNISSAEQQRRVSWKLLNLKNFAEFCLFLIWTSVRQTFIAKLNQTG